MDKITQFFNRQTIIKKGLNNDNLSIDNKLNLLEVLSTFSPRIIGNKIEMICTLINHNVPGNWVDRINNSIKFGKDSSSLDSYIVRYGDEIGVKLFNEKNRKSSTNKEKFLINHTKEEWSDLCNRKATWGLKKCVNKYGEINGPVKWQDRLNKKTETQRLRRESGHVYKNGRTLYEYQLKHGIEKGYELWNKRNDTQKHRFSEQYYIEKHGKINGSAMWHSYKQSMNKTSLCKFIERYGEIIGTEKYLIHLEKTTGNNRGNVSKISQELFWNIYGHINNNTINFAELNGEYKFYIDNKIIMVDFKYNNKIIEFNGDYWHANPKIYMDNDEITYPGGSIIIARDVRNRDIERNNRLINYGYNILEIWESDYKKNKNEVIQQCLEFLKD